LAVGAAAVPAAGAVCAAFGLSLQGTVRVTNLAVTPPQATATFTISSECVTAIRGLIGQNSPALCRVMVRCDFLIDANGQAVDGNHLSGAVPTGDGTPGGTFESWFLLTG
jgi:hypothetical protein